MEMGVRTNFTGFIVISFKAALISAQRRDWSSTIHDPVIPHRNSDIPPEPSSM